jgi:hypothetical protein
LHQGSSDVSEHAVEAVNDSISTKRAYIEVLAVFLAFFGSGVIAAAIDVAGARRPGGDIGWADIAPASFGKVAQAAIAVALVILLSQRRNRSVADLGLAIRGRLSASVGIRAAAWATLALIVGAIVTTALASSGFPFGPNNNAYLTYGLFSAVNAGIVEETVVLAFVAVTLSQANRSWHEIILVALLLRISYHIYYGPGAIGILVWAAVFLWLFRRTNSIVPMIIVHIGWDTFGFLAHRWPGVGAIEGAVILILFVTAPILWLSDRSEKKRLPAPGWAAGAGPNGAHGWPGGPAAGLAQTPGPVGAPGWPPPGWHPDPGRSDQLRWWDGQAWTGFAIPRSADAPPRWPAGGGTDDPGLPSAPSRPGL